jgi:tetratricopeptide (TPR) repeat protein
MADLTSKPLLVVRGKSVAFTGRFASMTRTEAADLLRAHGARCVSGVTRHTALLVVGQDGWPLRKNGGLAGNLAKAQKLQQAGRNITIETEQNLLAALGLGEHSEDIRRLYSTAQLSEIIGIPGVRVRDWMKAGLIRPVQTARGVAYFDFQQVTGAKTLCGLARAGVNTERIRQSLQQLGKWIKGVDQPLAQLTVLEHFKHPLVRRSDGQLSDTNGQLVFEFAPEAHEPSLSLNGTSKTAEEWFSLGLESEQNGQLAEAAGAYRQALLLGGPDAEIIFTLGNTHYQLGEKVAAAERFRQAVELDGSHLEAWNNLGNVLSELHKHNDALVAYRKALDIDFQYADAHYNLADLLETMGRPHEARRHWQAYLCQDAHSEWAVYARKRLARS